MRAGGQIKVGKKFLSDGLIWLSIRKTVHVGGIGFKRIFLFGMGQITAALKKVSTKTLRLQSLMEF